MSVVLAAIGAISRHNVNPVSGDAPRYGVATEAPNLPSLDTLMKSFKQSLVSGPLKEIEKHLSLPQERFCMAHGCVQASKDPVITLQDCGAGCLDFGQDYVEVDPLDVINTFNKGRHSFHWLWRLQETEARPQAKGISFDLYQHGNHSLKVFVTTKQEYEPMWIGLCWFCFVLRFLLTIAIDAFAANMIVKCNRGHDDDDDDDDGVEVRFLDVFASYGTYFMIACLMLLDLANILNPLLNPTAVQQGEFLWAATNLEAANFLGYTGVKLEMALIPASITVAGRMLTGDEDISMELFLFQMGIFVGPYILGKMGYGFELNTSTLILFINWIAQGSSNGSAITND